MTDRIKYRLLEMVPASLAWSTFLVAGILSVFQPLWAIYFIILFDLFWVFRVSYFVFYVVIAWWRYRQAIEVDWLTKLIQENPEEYQKKYHIIFYPFYNEAPEVLFETFTKLTKIKYDLKKIIVVLGGEERNLANAEKAINLIKINFSNKFFRCLFTIHPKNLPNELAGKGANSNYMGWQAKKMIDELQIPYEDLIVSYFDCDTVTHSQYYAYLTYVYIHHPHPTRSSYQPVVLFNNNIWESNPITRVTAFATSFWLLSELMRPERMFTFSSHSMSWKALVDVGFFQKDIVTDDSRIFLQGYFHYDGDYEVTPLYVPVSMDTVDAPTVKQSLINLYKQQRRWAYGIEHFPYMVWNFTKNKKISWHKKFHHLFNITEGMYSWATAPILIFVLNRLPLFFLEEKNYNDAIIQNAPFILEKLMFLATAGIFVSAILSVLILPKRPEINSRHDFLIMILQWLLLPITLICFGSIPAMDAQTRLMFGKYLGFFNTPKAR